MYSIAREYKQTSSTLVALEILSGHHSIQTTEDVVHLFTLVFRILGEDATPQNLVDFFSSHSIRASYEFCQDDEVDEDYSNPSVMWVYDLYINEKEVVRISYFESNGQRHLCPDFIPLI